MAWNRKKLIFPRKSRLCAPAARRGKIARRPLQANGMKSPRLPSSGPFPSPPRPGENILKKALHSLKSLGIVRFLSRPTGRKSREG
jgi:hypothetical protein